MGVHNLWKLIEPAKQKINIDTEFKNKSIAIDLSIWLYEFKSIKMMKGKINLFLRYLLLRIKFFLKNNCKLIFIWYFCYNFLKIL